MGYEHCFINGDTVEWPVGKIVCVGRNYREHAKELNNPIPTEPLLFIKPSTSAVVLDQPLLIPRERGSCHFETEIALLIAKPLNNASLQQCQEAVMGVGIALDLTLRDVQNQLKKQGHPWEKAKAFDGSCPLSRFVPTTMVSDWETMGITMHKNAKLQQDDISGSMITPIFSLLHYISQHFTLLPGDVVLTGTPAGVGALESGDTITVALDQWLSVSTKVV